MFLNDVFRNENEINEQKTLINRCSILRWDVFERDLDTKKWRQLMVINNKES